MEVVNLVKHLLAVGVGAREEAEQRSGYGAAARLAYARYLLLLHALARLAYGRGDAGGEVEHAHNRLRHSAHRASAQAGEGAADAALVEAAIGLRGDGQRAADDADGEAERAADKVIDAAVVVYAAYLLARLLVIFVERELVELVGERAGELGERVGDAVRDREDEVGHLAVGDDVGEALLEVDHEAERIAEEVPRAEYVNGVSAQLLRVVATHEAEQGGERLVLVEHDEGLALDVRVLELDERYAESALDLLQVVAELGRLEDAEAHADAVDLKAIEAVLDRLRVPHQRVYLRLVEVAERRLRAEVAGRRALYLLLLLLLMWLLLEVRLVAHLEVLLEHARLGRQRLLAIDAEELNDLPQELLLHLQHNVAHRDEQVLDGEYVLVAKAAQKVDLEHFAALLLLLLLLLLSP